MTRIDFHTNVKNKITYACRLVRKAYGAMPGCGIVLLAADPTQLDILDQALWTLSDTDFLPHVKASDPMADRTPIILTDDDKLEWKNHHVLINLSGKTPGSLAQCERVFEVIGQDDEDTDAGRHRYRAYKLQGFSLTHFVAENA